MSENKKIKNATTKTYDNINFKSVTEVMVYKTLKERDYNVEYETMKFNIFDSFKPVIPFYINKKGSLVLDGSKQRAITYTPDFILNHKGRYIFIEVKGYTNDVYPYKRKMFRKYLEKNYPNSLFFEVYTKKNVLEMIDIIEKL